MIAKPKVPYQQSEEDRIAQLEKAEAKRARKNAKRLQERK